MNKKRLFKKGDVVKVTSPWHSADKSAVGKVFVVSRDQNDGKDNLVYGSLLSRAPYYKGWASYEIELVRRAGDIRVGDKVRCKKTYRGQFTEGKIYRVVSTIYGIDLEADDKGQRNGFSCHTTAREMFELDLSTFSEDKDVKSKERTELEELVRKVNERNEAIKELRTKYTGKFEEKINYLLSGNTHTEWNEPRQPMKFDTIYEFRVKPALPKPFKLKDSGYEVSFPSANEVKVGCQEFSVTELCHDLKYIMSDGKVGEFGAFTLPLRAIRSGLLYQPNSKILPHHIHWADAEQLLAALEKAVS